MRGRHGRRLRPGARWPETEIDAAQGAGHQRRAGHAGGSRLHAEFSGVGAPQRNTGQHEVRSAWIRHRNRRHRARAADVRRCERQRCRSDADAGRGGNARIREIRRQVLFVAAADVGGKEQHRRYLADDGIVDRRGIVRAFQNAVLVARGVRTVTVARARATLRGPIGVLVKRLAAQRILRMRRRNHQAERTEQHDGRAKTEA